MNKTETPETKEDVKTDPKPSYKKAMDYGIGSVALVVFTPIIIPALIASAIIHQSNPFYNDERVGKGGRIFKLHKIKTMRDAFNSATGEPLPEEQRLTKLGEFLRRSKIDELPQILNVLKGDLSLVGPRPLRETNETSQNAFRQSVEPGMTGLQQITGGNRLSYEDRLMIDHQYIRRRNVFLDLGILVATPGAIFKQRRDPHFNTDTDKRSSTDDTPPEP